MTKFIHLKSQTIPPPPPISTIKQSLKKICQEMLKKESGNEVLRMDRLTNGHSMQIFELAVLHNIPHFLSGGLKLFKFNTRQKRKKKKLNVH